VALSIPLTAVSSPSGQTVSIRSSVATGGYQLTIDAGLVTITPSWLPFFCTADPQTAVLSAGMTVEVDILPLCQSQAFWYGDVSSPTLGELDGVTISVDNAVTLQTSGGGNFAIDAPSNGLGTTATFSVTGGLPAGCTTPAPITATRSPDLALVRFSVVCQ
jgi:hypothetical protein